MAVEQRLLKYISTDLLDRVARRFGDNNNDQRTGRRLTTGVSSNTSSDPGKRDGIMRVA